jgi:hypothetical protein
VPTPISPLFGCQISRPLIPSSEKLSNNMSNNLGLSYTARKALCVQLGEAAGTEVANLLQRMAAQIEELKRSKVNVTQVVPGVHAKDDRLDAIFDAESF